MGEASKISWTDHTFNPWWGCARVSPGCQHCYAEAFAKRTGHDVWGKGGRRFFGEKHWAEPLKWDAAAERAGRPALVFCASMADVFEHRPEGLVEASSLDDERARLWDLVDRTPHLIWLLLTKRPENVAGMVPEEWFQVDYLGQDPVEVFVGSSEQVHWWSRRWPRNVWIGTTAEDQQRAMERIPHLCNLPAPVRFLSCEPLLEPVDLYRALNLEWMDALDDPASREVWKIDEGGWGREMFATLGGARQDVDWVIAGGESGPGHRPFNPLWARALAEQCHAAGVPFFFKQHGGRTPTAGGDLLDGRQHHAWPAAAGDRS